MATKKGKADGLVGKKAKPIPKPEKEIGMDVDDKFISALLVGADSSQVDLQTLDNFGSTSQARESVYSLIDTMAQDDRVSAVLETYAEDATETNEKGSVIWCESSESNVVDYVSNLLDQLNVDKHAYEWTYTLCKYGDVYLRLYRESDYGNDPVFGFGRKDGKGRLNESSRADEAVSVSIPEANDRYVPYVEMVPNPGEMFELTKFGKTVGYIQAPVMVQNHDEYDRLSSTFLTYRMDRGDVSVYGATDFVHAYLNNDNSTRVPEEVEIFHGDGDSKTVDGTYRVRKGQSLLYNEFRVWRELSLMENTVLLNRITKSALTRILQIEVGDMPQYKVKAVMDFIKSKLEQKTAVSVGQSMQEYTNPGPVENIIYLPTHGGQGAVSAQTLGGDYDPKQLTDLNYFLDKFYGALRVPKQYFSCLRGDTQIVLLDGTTHTISEMYEHAEDFVGKGIMACDIDGTLVPTKITEVLLTKPQTTFIRIHLDNGKYVDVTEDHRMMLRDGTFVFAKDIKEGDSLMPYYERMNDDGRKEVLDNKEVTKVEKLDVVEPAYDINVEASCHTFALPCGIFVHNCTDDSTGFNGGSSLSIISSRYGKAVKRIQNAVCQMVTDLVNIFLIDRGLDAYVGKFAIRMQAPITQEELDRRDNMRNRMAVMTDVMGQIDNVVTDDVIKAKISKSLLSQIVTDPDVISLLQEQIDALEAAKKDDEAPSEGDKGDNRGGEGGSRGGEGASRGALDDFGASLGYGGEGGSEPSGETHEAPSAGQEAEHGAQEGPEAEPEAESEAGDSYLPSPGELGIDLTGGIE